MDFLAATLPLLQPLNFESTSMTTTSTPTPYSPTDHHSDLLARVKPDPHRPSPDRWRLIPSDRPIWAIIMDIYTIDEIDEIDDAFQTTAETIKATATDYDISEDEVRAALAYYAANPEAIDTILATNTDLDLRPRHG